MKKKQWAIALGGALAVVVVGAGVVMAQTPAPGSGTNGPSFLDRVAQKLGIDTGKLHDAIKGARTDQIDEAVANGDLTQKQADNLKNKIQNAPNGGGFGFPGPGKREFRPGGKGVFGFGFGLGDAGQKFADFLGISTDQLATELHADGATLATVAGAHGKSRDDVKALITSTAKTQLDAAVANGDLTQKREDEALSNLNSHLDELLDHGPGKGGPRGFRLPFGRPGAPRDPNVTPSAPNQSGTSSGLFKS
ncbi:MAG: hypothetical protein M3P30_01765 [Chloroflexota bacterium]|nr:hypothetical protein [Chloroflexota bacterium]